MSCRLLVGDARDVLEKLPEKSIHCVVTSPPYYGLRAYLVDDHADKHREIGLEASLEAYITTLAAMFRLVRRVMRDDATLWLNLGDSYAAAGGHTSQGSSSIIQENGQQAARNFGTTRIPTGFKPKDLMMVPARVAIALQDDGWYLRSDIIWAKRAPMPESVTDRPTSAHEHVFLLTKKARYFYDAEAVKEQTVSLDPTHSSYRPNSVAIAENGRKEFSNKHEMSARSYDPAGRNLRNVWHLGPEPYPDAHFATFPTEIPKRAILAGTSAKGCCAACGAPWVRVVDKEGYSSRPNSGAIRGFMPSSHRSLGQPQRGSMYANVQTIGWQPSCLCERVSCQQCDYVLNTKRAAESSIEYTRLHPLGCPRCDGKMFCNPPDPIACTVLDPFAGAGTTLLVADRLGRDAIGIELSAEYAEMARQRITGDAPMFAEVTTT